MDTPQPMHYQPATSARVSGLCRPQVLPNGLAMMTPWPDTMGSRIPAQWHWSCHRPGRARAARRPGGRAVWPRPSASWRSVRPGRRRRSGARAGRRRRWSRYCFQCPGGDHHGADRRGGGLRASSRRAGSTGTAGVSVAGRTPALRAAPTAGGPVALPRTVGHGLEPRHEAAAGGPAGMPALRGWAGGRPRTGRRAR
jgi:hypothetical protein